MSLPPQVSDLVRRTYGENASIVDVDVPGAWQVARLSVATDGGSEQVVAKWLRSDPRGWRTDPRQMMVETVGLRFVGELVPDLVPKVIASSFEPRTGGAVLLEDLHPRQPLDALIRRDGAAATAEARRCYARAIGRLAASTAGRDDAFHDRLGESATADPRERRLNLLGPPWPKLRADLVGLGLVIGSAAEEEMLRLRRFLAEPGPFLALSNGDLAANNFMINSDSSDSGRLIDFEAAHFDHAVAHVAGFYVPGPAWMVVNDPIAAQLDAEYRTALAEGIPAAGDDERYRTAVAAGCIAMGFERCGNLPVMESRAPGHPSRAQRIATVEAAAAAAETVDRWSALSDLLRDLADLLRNRWPDADRDFSVLPPYTARGR